MKQHTFLAWCLALLFWRKSPILSSGIQLLLLAVLLRPEKRMFFGFNVGLHILHLVGRFKLSFGSESKQSRRASSE